MIPMNRQNQIAAWLADQRTLTIEEIAARLGVSVMTVHRDLDALARDGLVVKVRGGVTLVERRGHPDGQTCALCNLPIQDRTAFIIQVQDADPVVACCGHCGFLLLCEMPQPVSVLVKDFLYGRTMNARQAFYVVDSAVQACCLPSVLCFASQSDARRFHKGFEGVVMDFAAAQAHLSGHHDSEHS